MGAISHGTGTGLEGHMGLPLDWQYLWDIYGLSGRNQDTQGGQIISSIGSLIGNTKRQKF